ncbi:MAG: protein-tyrosine phosphatase, partial [Gaiellaceae bacterium]|nr:protein-tyrosine phosphatase [Gaiellaceae bacterium]
MTALTWEGLLNVRDLGGHPTEDGAVTRHRVVVRADALRQLSDAGWEALAGYGIARIVDLRFHDEREADPPRDLPAELVHVSLLGAERD